MARLNNPRPSTEVSLWPNRATPQTESRNPSSSPAASFGSDKENRIAHRHQGDKNMSKRPMEPPHAPTSTNPRANKRRRVTDEGPTKPRETANSEGRVGSKWFDPDQNPEERREVRIGSRKLQREWNQRKGELLHEGGFGEIREILEKHERHFKGVKQTADALDDSRQMIEISDLVHAKTQRLGNGDSELGINVDDFINRWIYFGKNGKVQGADEDDSAPSATQIRRRRAQTQTQRSNGDSDDEEAEDINGIQWDLLGERVCFPNNNRPPVPSFLLGPLAVQKKIRATQRQGRQRREPLAAVTKPQDIRPEDLEKNEASNLTNQCAAIRTRLRNAHKECIEAFEAEWNEDMEEADTNELLRKHNLSTNWELPLLKFAINPNSFGQTVENLFYISFVVKDGFVHVSKDDDGLPTLRPVDTDGEPDAERQSGVARHQAIFSIDYETWQKFIRAYDINETMIPHRDDENVGQPNAHGWYA